MSVPTLKLPESPDAHVQGFPAGAGLRPDTMGRSSRDLTDHNQR
jgi:hypothetical protein